MNNSVLPILINGSFIFCFLVAEVTVKQNNQTKPVNTDSVTKLRDSDGRYYCSKCPKSFKRAYDIRVHITSHSGTNPHYCKCCDSYFSRPSKLSEHFRTKTHLGKFSLYCSQCSEGFSSLFAINKHRLTQHCETASKKTKLSESSETDEVVDKEDTVSQDDKLTDESVDICFDDSFVRDAEGCLLCMHCEKAFEEEADFRIHVKEQHDIKINLDSPSKVHTDDYKKPRDHLLTKLQSKETKLFCPECNSDFSNWECLNTHLETTHLDSGVTEFSCKQCELTFQSKKEWVRHLTTNAHLAKAHGSFKASCCDKTFKTHKACYNHERVHLRTSPYHCATCDRYFLKKHHMVKHITSCHNQSERLYACPYCPRSYKTSSQLDRHLECGHSFNCVTCLQVFSCRPFLKTHLKQSPECVRNICSRCNNMEFESIEDFAKHKKGMHNITKVKKTYSCSECGKTYCEAFKLKQHMQWHTTGRYPFQCDMCSVVCYKKSKLDNHVNTVHLKICPYACDECEESFKKKNSYDQHMSEKHGAKSFVCPICDKVLYTKKTFESHQLNHTKVSTQVSTRSQAKDEFVDLRALTDLSMALDSRDGEVLQYLKKPQKLSVGASAPEVKIPSIMTGEPLPLPREMEEDMNDDFVGSEETGVAANSDKYSPEIEDPTETIKVLVQRSDSVATPTFEIINHNETSTTSESLKGLLAQQPVTIKIAPSLQSAIDQGGTSGTNEELSSQTMQQLRSTLSDLLSVTLQEPYMTVPGDGEELGDTSEGDTSESMVEIVLVHNQETDVDER